MPYSHHSHSGQFCKHAKNTLMEMFAAARARRMRVFALTEHLPRPNAADLYPEEREANLDPAKLSAQFEDFVRAAREIQRQADTAAASDPQTPHVLVGFEGDWIRSDESAAVIRGLLSRPQGFDFWLGSVHHVRTIPIDFDRPTYEHAREACGGTEEALFLAYYEAQHEMLVALQPPVVSHFDLIRLLSDDPGRTMGDLGNGSVWTQIKENLNVIRTYGGLLEINSSALRKGLAEPYPRLEICREWVRLGGDFILSDDSHAVEQVGVCYDQVQTFFAQLGKPTIAYLAREGGRVMRRHVPVHKLWEGFFSN